MVSLPVSSLEQSVDISLIRDVDISVLREQVEDCMNEIMLMLDTSCLS